MMRRFGVKVGIGVWEDETDELLLTPMIKGPGEVRRICVAGAIGYEKGYDMLLQCARMIVARRLPLEFTLVGFTCDDSRLLDTGCVQITGPYGEKEAVSLIQRQEPDFAFLPALWPETWSYVLSQYWEAGLPVIAFDIGAPAERIRRRNGGIVLPLNLGVNRLLQIFLEPRLFSYDGPSVHPPFAHAAE
jgi:glycosyltransferase involved in cell wall biosynthesis